MLSSSFIRVLDYLLFDSAWIYDFGFCLIPEWTFEVKFYFFILYFCFSCFFSATESQICKGLSQYNLAMTDSAEEDVFRSALRAQGSLLHDHEQQLSSLVGGVQQLQARQDAFQTSLSVQFQDLSNQMQQMLAGLRTTASDPPAQPAPQPREAYPVVHPDPRLPRIERYDGDPSTCRSFLSLCSMTFELQPHSYPSESSRVAFMITHLSGRAREWATAEWDKKSLTCVSARSFAEALRKVFDHRTPGREAARGLLDLRQGSSRVADHAIRFRTLASESEWGENSLCDTFLHSLSEDIKDHLAPLDLPSKFDSLVALAIKIDNRLHERRMEKARCNDRPPAQWGQPSPFRFPAPSSVPVRPADSASVSPSGKEEPMQLGRTPLSSEERQRRRREGRCLYCGKLGHFLAACPLKDRAHQ